MNISFCCSLCRCLSIWPAPFISIHLIRSTHFMYCLASISVSVLYLECSTSWCHIVFHVTFNAWPIFVDILFYFLPTLSPSHFYLSFFLCSLRFYAIGIKHIFFSIIVYYPAISYCIHFWTFKDVIKSNGISIEIVSVKWSWLNKCTIHTDLIEFIAIYRCSKSQTIALIYL